MVVRRFDGALIAMRQEHAQRLWVDRLADLGLAAQAKERMLKGSARDEQRSDPPGQDYGVPPAGAGCCSSRASTSEHRQPRPVATAERVSVEQLRLKRGEEAFGNHVVERITAASSAESGPFWSRD